MVVLYLLAIEYRLSPFLTVYVNVESGLVPEVDGIFNIWPIDKLFVVKLFMFFIASTVVL